MKTVNNMQNVKRDDYITWDEYFIGIAKLSSMRSKDPSTQVGCCIVSKDNRILSVGYNGAPNGFDDDMFPWGRVGEKLDTKYMFVSFLAMSVPRPLSSLVSKKLFIHIVMIMITIVMKWKLLFVCLKNVALLIVNLNLLIKKKLF